jgi:3',5'-nucleoside bisphosphate phosphatase
MGKRQETICEWSLFCYDSPLFLNFRSKRLNHDLHCHSNCSDGVLDPAALVERAHAMGVNVLALTDHDEVTGLEAAARAAQAVGMRLVNGVEISVTWCGHTLHVVGLGFDPAYPALAAGLAAVRQGRAERAQAMGEALARIGFRGALEGARALAGNQEVISRTHFARHLVAEGRAKDVRSVFKHYLVKGKPGYVTHRWAELSDAISWISDSGGMAVLAHPGRYNIGKHAMRDLLDEFANLGGVGIEVVTGSHRPEHVPFFARLAEEFDLFASRGSDFHAPGEGGRELGRLQSLPERCVPIWQHWYS